MKHREYLRGQKVDEKYRRAVLNLYLVRLGSLSISDENS